MVEIGLTIFFTAYQQYVLRARCVVLRDSFKVQAQTWVLPA